MCKNALIWELVYYTDNEYVYRLILQITECIFTFFVKSLLSTYCRVIVKSK